MAYWDSVAYLLAQYPTLADSNVAAFTYLYPNTSAAGLGGDAASFDAVFALYDPASTSTLETLLAPFVRHVNNTYANRTTTKATSTVFPSFYSMFLKFADDSGAGVDKVVGSRLLPPKTLTAPAFSGALKEFLGEAGGRLYMVSGKGVWNAKPRGGSAAVNPAWRKALIHAGKQAGLFLSVPTQDPDASSIVASQDWTPLDESERVTVESNINNIQVEALRQLVPESGAYLNEVCCVELRVCL